MVDVPTFQINQKELQNIVGFIHNKERVLKKYGAIKIQPNIQCKFALKKKPKKLVLHPITKRIAKVNSNNLIYSVRNISRNDKVNEQTAVISDECSPWSDLSSYLNNDQRQLNISYSLNSTFFLKKMAQVNFDIHRIPKMSLLRLAGKEIISECVPCVKRAHGIGAIFPLSCTEQHLFSLDYHHEGGIHHWYIIPNDKREALSRLINKEDSSICLDHGQIVIDPLFLDKHHIRYHRIKQCPNEFVVLSADALSQSFAEDASWSESIVFALPSWVEEGHASKPSSSCQCDIFNRSLSKTIDDTVFSKEMIQQYIKSYLDNNTNDKSIILKDQNYSSVMTTSTMDDMQSSSCNDEPIIPSNVKLMFSSQQVVPSHDSASNVSTTSLISNFLNEDGKYESDINNGQFQYQVLESGLPVTG
ncbi:unnamed protein product [Adineta ricciae]|uniref:Dolichyl-diphosphooligosaccharide--protein glycosyltransferase subunit 2 n=1 Tax=Adineta ricciae TaxID=249248 RepID=A0A816C5M0_ADIRI|nr:unnamed protein product [Adineta ricciae]